MTGTVLFIMEYYYLFHSYFDNYSRVFYIFSVCLCINICLRSFGQWLWVQFRETLFSSAEPLTSNHSIFVSKHKVILKLWQDSIRSQMLRALKCLICVSTTKWSFHLLWKYQECKREPPQPINRVLFCSLSYVNDGMMTTQERFLPFYLILTVYEVR